jgi:chromosome segregation ATPase
MDYLRVRMESLERELGVERERARAAEGMIKQQDSLRSEVEGQMKAISEQLRQQKALQELEHEKAGSKGRVEALEQRLDEMHKTWASLLKDAMTQRGGEVEQASAEVRGLGEAVAGLRRDFQTLKEHLCAVPARSPDVQELSALVPALAKARTEDERLLREQLREMVAGFGDAMSGRLKELSDRFAGEAARQRERLETLERERTALRDAIEAQRHDLRQDALKANAEIDRKAEDQLAALRRTVVELAERQMGSGEAVQGVRKALEDLRAGLARPETARDEILKGLEAEKKDLLNALHERTEQLRSYVLERREIERGLGESLMETNRQLELERAAHARTRESVAGLERAIEALKAEAELRRQEVSDRDARISQVAAERDAVLQTLAEEAEKVRRQIAARMDSDRAWEEKLLEQQGVVDAERRQRVQTEESASSLRTQLQTLTDHVSRLIREKEAVENRFADWEKQRQELEGQLRKKDEMVAMLSTTFRNLVKKPLE